MDWDGIKSCSAILLSLIPVVDGELVFTWHEILGLVEAFTWHEIWSGYDSCLQVH